MIKIRVSTTMQGGGQLYAIHVQRDSQHHVKVCLKGNSNTLAKHSKKFPKPKKIPIPKTNDVLHSHQC